MSILDKICKEALTWIDTPYHYQARVKGVGVDCCNLIAGVGEELGLLKDVVIKPYNIQWHLHSKSEDMLYQLESFGCYELRVELDRPETWPIGSIITFKFGRANSHLGILVQDNRLVHAAADYGKVVHSYFTDTLLNRVGHLYSFPGII
jgi:cell wall-associated NlpC family hydrolase